MISPLLVERKYFGVNTSKSFGVLVLGVLFLSSNISSLKKHRAEDDQILGRLSIIQPNVTLPRPGFISTLNVINATADISDPNGWLKNHTKGIALYWQISNKNTKNNTILGPCFTPSIILNITTPGDYFIESNVILALSDQTVTTTTRTTSTTTTTPTVAPNSTTTTIAPHNNTTTTPRPPPSTPSPAGYKCDGWWNGYDPKYGNFEETDYRTRTTYGFFFSEVVAAEPNNQPMYNFNVSGSTRIRHGALLTLQVRCSGTGPFFFCKNITFGSFNESDPKICSDTPIETNVCDFVIKQHPSQTGTYTLVIRIFNGVSERLERFAINVYNEIQPESKIIHLINKLTNFIYKSASEMSIRDLWK